MPLPFVHYCLRTLAPTTSRQFYRDVFGWSEWPAELSVEEMPPGALARRAPPHWLGYLETPNPDEVLRWTARGATRLGPGKTGDEGSFDATLRDPLGAIIGLRSPRPSVSTSAVRWHLHISINEQRAFDYYELVAGWAPGPLLELGPNGRHRQFGISVGTPELGSFCNLATREGIHPQWLYFFAVDDLEISAARIRAAGGLVSEPTETTRGDRVAACDDPWGAAFGIIEPQSA